MRETSGRLEETPGEEGSPAYFDSSIKGVYESTGASKTNDGSAQSLTNDRHGVARGRQLRRVGDVIGARNSGDLSRNVISTPASVPIWRAIHSAVGCLVTSIQIRSLRSSRSMTKARATRSVRRDDEHIHRGDIRGMIR